MTGSDDEQRPDQDGAEDQARRLERVRAALAEHLSQVNSLMLATLCDDGAPLASYAPCIRDADGAFCVFISELSAHTRNLRRSPNASVLLIEDEQGAREPFARRRVTLRVTAEFVPPEEDRWIDLANAFEGRFGQIIQVFRGLGDFRLVRLVPRAGSFVVGFGQAYDLSGDRLTELAHIDADTVKRRMRGGTGT
jgi:putative heme iron utilization protein